MAKKIVVFITILGLVVTALLPALSLFTTQV